MAIAKGTKRVAENRKARHEYFIEDTYECGIALVGTEVKSIRAGKVNLKDSYAQVKNGECYLIGMHVRGILLLCAALEKVAQALILYGLIHKKSLRI